MNDNSTHVLPRHHQAAILDRQADLALSVGRVALAEFLSRMAFELRLAVPVA